MPQSIGRVIRALGLTLPLVLSASACQWMALVSGDQDGVPQEGYVSSVDGAGRYVVFYTAAKVLPDDTNAMSDVYRRDLRDGTTVRVSVDGAGEDANGWSEAGAVSADGRFVAFSSTATDFLPGDTNGQQDVYLRDMETGTFTRVSVDSVGGDLHGDALVHSISADGTKVAFTVSAYGGTDYRRDVYVRDLTLGTTTFVGVPGSGNEYWPALSADGGSVAFTYAAGEFPSIDDNIYIRNLTTNVLTMVSVDTAGGPAGGTWGDPPAVSGDGRYVAFSSDASNIVPGDANGDPDIFVRDMQTGATRRISVDVSGGDPDEQSLFPDISDDGRFVAFESDASDLVPGDTEGTRDAFVRDLVEGTTTRASVDVFDHPTLSGGQQPQLSGDGKVIAFDGVVAFATLGVYARVVLEPTITGVSPSHLPRGAVSTVTITGSGFGSDTRVIVALSGVTVGTVTVVDEHHVQVALTVAPGAPQATGDIWVGTPGPGVGFFGMTGSVAVARGALTVT